MYNFLINGYEVIKMKVEFVPASKEFEDDIYDLDVISEYHDDDAISSAEAAFMAGYLES